MSLELSHPNFEPVDKEAPFGKMLYERFRLQEALATISQKQFDAEQVYTAIINEIIQLNQEIAECDPNDSNVELLHSLGLLKSELKNDLETAKQSLLEASEQYQNLIRWQNLNLVNLEANHVDTPFFSNFYQGIYTENDLFVQPQTLLFESVTYEEVELSEAA
jgi:hypothetical protein